MEKPVLVIMAAGIGSRFGGLKQIEPVDNRGHIIMDFSVFDAKRAGFETVVFIIKPEIEADFRRIVGRSIEKHMEVKYAMQTLNALPSGFAVPEGRVKPWGTGHAVLCAASVVNGPFAAINADDFYGVHSFAGIYNFLRDQTDDAKHAMVGYRIENTLTEHGSVARGICSADDNGYLTEIRERTHIERRESGGAYTEDGVTYYDIPAGTIVSLNMWGFGRSMMDELVGRFPAFLEKNLPINPLKCEYFLPSVVYELMSEGKATVKVLPCEDKWYGVTYREDKIVLEQAVRRMFKKGAYPEGLFEDV